MRTDTHSPALQVADSHETIRVHGARENNLRDLSVEIPKRRLTVFTGVSGSGKSSLVFGTIAAESQRLINETYSAFVQGFMPTLERPDVDVLEGLTPAIVVDQQRMGGDTRSTVGTATDAGAMLRILFSRLGQPHIGSPGAFSFNVPSVKASGAITIERGTSNTVRATFTDACAMQISDLAGWVRGLDELPVAPLLAKLEQTLDSFAEIGLGYLSLERPSGTLSGGEAQRVKTIGHLSSSLTDVTYVFDEPTTGLHPHDIQRMNDLLLRLRDKGNTVLVVEHEPDTIAIADHVVDLGPGAGSAGGRVCFEGTVEGLRASGTITGRHLEDRASLKETPAAHAILERLVEVGLGYLSLGQPLTTLSGGERQRLQLATHMAEKRSRRADGTDSIYILDEPTSGLHLADVEQLLGLLDRLVDSGKSVIVIEHHQAVMAHADWIIDLGPSAGHDGGNIVFEGTPAELVADRSTLTGEHLAAYVGV
jgi:excinuclease UvrABC ATPase subunit